MNSCPRSTGADSSAPANNHHIPPDRLRAEIEIQRPAPIDFHAIAARALAAERPVVEEALADAAREGGLKF